VGSNCHKEKEKRRVLLVAGLLGWVGLMGLNRPTETQGGRWQELRSWGATQQT
jgi:hypothetical protein